MSLHTQYLLPRLLVCTWIGQFHAHAHTHTDTQHRRTCTHSCTGTIEERILKLQDKKQLVFEGTVGRDAEALTRLTEDDLRFLFS